LFHVCDSWITLSSPALGDYPFLSCNVFIISKKALKISTLFNPVALND
jgi:hypothetical protein